MTPKPWSEPPRRTVIAAVRHAPMWMQALLLLVGAAAVALFYEGVRYFMWSQAMPVNEQRREIETPLDEAPNADLPAAAAVGTPVQKPEEGTGNLFRRRYRVTIDEPTLSAESLMAQMKANPNDFSPEMLARFEKTKGADGQMAVGDEFFIHILGPWNGPVRVTHVAPEGFSFVTLQDHLEAGQINFRAAEVPERPDAIRFEIHSEARSRDKSVEFAYEIVGIAKAAQTSMWANWCRRVVEKSGGTLVGEIDVLTEKQPIKEDESEDA